jgi:hypothetical protein
MVEKRLFEDLIDSGKERHGTQQSKVMPVSLLLHSVIAATIIIVPLLSADQLPDPASAVKAFFVEPMAAPAPPPRGGPPPPPPPPPPPRPSATFRATSHRPLSSYFGALGLSSVNVHVQKYSMFAGPTAL